MCREFALYSGLGTFELELKEANEALAKEALVLEVLLLHSRRNSNNEEWYIPPQTRVITKKPIFKIPLKSICPLM